MADLPLGALGDLAGFVRTQLAAMADRMGGLVRTGHDSAVAARDEVADRTATVIVAASAPFALTAQARARLLRQLHASGLLTTTETQQANELLRRHAS